MGITSGVSFHIDGFALGLIRPLESKVRGVCSDLGGKRTGALPHFIIRLRSVPLQKYSSC